MIAFLPGNGTGYQRAGVGRGRVERVRVCERASFWVEEWSFTRSTLFIAAISLSDCRTTIVRFDAVLTLVFLSCWYRVPEE